MTIGGGKMRGSVSLLVLLLFTAPALAQPEVERFFPPSAAIGEATEIKAEGKFSGWPLEAWCDREDVSVEAADEEGRLTVRVESEAAPGVAWIRLYDAEGASSLRPIVIDRAATQLETEPNGGLEEAESAELPLRIVGKLEKRGDVDTVAVDLQAEQTVVVSVVANRALASPMDAIVQLVDAEGHVLAQSDDQCGLDPQLIFTPQSSGKFFVRLFAFPETPTSAVAFAGGADFVYEARVTSGPFFDFALPLAPAADADPLVPIGSNLTGEHSPRAVAHRKRGTQTLYAPGALGWAEVPAGVTEAVVSRTVTADGMEPIGEFPASVSGRFDEPRQTHRIPLVLVEGTKYRVTADSLSLGLVCDPSLRLVSEEGKEIAARDDRSRNDFDATLEFTAPSDGQFILEVVDAVSGFGPRHVYAARIAEVQPGLGLKVDADQFVLSAGEAVEIPVTIDRRDGFDATVTVTAEGLPEGITAAPVESEPKGDTSKKVTLKIEGQPAEAASGVFSIVATDESGSLRRTARASLVGGATTEALWITVVPKEDEAGE